MEGALEASCPEAIGTPLAGDKWRRGGSQGGGRWAWKRKQFIGGGGGGGGASGGAAADPAPAQVSGTRRPPDRKQLSAQAGPRKDPVGVPGCAHLQVLLGGTDGGGGLGTQGSHWGERAVGFRVPSLQGGPQCPQKLSPVPQFSQTVTLVPLTLRGPKAQWLLFLPCGEGYRPLLLSSRNGISKWSQRVGARPESPLDRKGPELTVEEVGAAILGPRGELGLGQRGL